MADDDSEHTAYTVIYVRPESNNVSYEAEILSGIRKMAEVIYLANLNGGFIQDRGILLNHYVAQFKFAAAPREGMVAFPEIRERFERHFGLRAAEARIIGSLEAVVEKGFGVEALFELVVPDEDFLNCYGQTFKRVGEYFIVNYDLPAVVERYTRKSNVFCVLVRLRDASPTFYHDLNQSIYEAIVSSPNTPVIFGVKMESLLWSERIRRTYHISTNNLMAMFDMADFIFRQDGTNLPVTETPLGLKLLSSGYVDEALLEKIRTTRLCYSQSADARTLEYLPHSGLRRDFPETGALLKGCAPYLS